MIRVASPLLPPHGAWRVANWTFAHPAQWERCNERPDVLLGYGGYGDQETAMEVMLAFLDGRIARRASPVEVIMRGAKNAQKARDAISAGHIDLFN